MARTNRHRVWHAFALLWFCGLFVAGCDGSGDPLVVRIEVPAVAGTLRADAEAELVAAGLRVGRVTTANSDTVAAGMVISQDPAAGAAVAPDRAVALVVSLGPLRRSNRRSERRPGSD